MRFDEEPDAPLHGECAARIAALEAALKVAREALRGGCLCFNEDDDCPCCGAIAAIDEVLK